jgi:phosphoserine phosphatase
MNTQPTQIKAVILDLDQTMTTDSGSWLQFTSMLGADPKIHADIFQRFKAGEISYPEAKKKLIALWRAASAGSIGKLDKASISEVFKKVELRSGAIEGVSYLKSKYKLCIISGAINIFVDIIAQKLSIQDHYSTTKLIFDQDNVLVDFDYILSQGEEKTDFLHNFCAQNNIQPEECAAIGDGASDMPLFNEVGLPILFVARDTTAEAKQKIKTQINSWSEVSTYL